MLNITTEHNQGIMVVALEGSLDTVTSDSFEKKYCPCWSITAWFCLISQNLLKSQARACAVWSNVIKRLQISKTVQWRFVP